MNGTHSRFIGTGNQLLQRASLYYNSKWLPWIIICFGIVLRLYHYLANRSLWLDEAALALGTINTPFLQLLEPLYNVQAAPIGFLMVERLIINIFGTSEYALRLFPFLCGIAALFLFYAVASRYLQPKSLPIALFLFAFCPSLIYYSSEVKQYSVDVAIALLLYLVAIHIDRERLTIPHILFYGVIGAVAVWFSHPSLFILISIAIVLALSSLRRREYVKLRVLSIIFSFWAFSFVASYLVSLQDLSGRQYLLDWWSFSFMPLPPSSISDAKWFLETFFGTFDYPVGLSLSGLAALSFLAGCISLYTAKKKTLLLLIFPIFLTLLASGFHKYPFSDRMLLFIVPSVLLLIAEGAELIRSKISSHNTAVLGIIFIGLLLIYPLNVTIDNILDPYSKQEIKPVIEYVRENQQDEDVLYIYYGAGPAFEYYSARYGYNVNDYVVGICSKENWENWNNYINELHMLRGNKRIWILFSHVCTWTGVDEEKFFLLHLDDMGTRLDSFKSAGASVYLYDLSQGEDIDAFMDCLWLVNTDGDHQTVNEVFWYGASGETSIVGDINQDGKDDIAIYKDGLWLVSTDGNPATVNLTFWYGASGETPVVGDINQDGKDDIATFHISVPLGLWCVNTNGDHQTVNEVFWYGESRVTVGDINQDGKDDIAELAGRPGD
jgi:hypothetical protein